MSVLDNSLLLGGEAAGGGGGGTGGNGYKISRSIRLNAPDSAYLSRTPATAGNTKTWTWSGWVKKCSATDQALISSGSYEIFGFQANGTLRYESNGNAINCVTTAVYRDPSAWMHVVLAVDTTQAGASRVSIYVNNSLQALSTAAHPAQGSDTLINGSGTQHMGVYSAGGARYVDGYLADIHFIDGQALTPASFGEFNSVTGQWIPKAYTGTYGTNGFKLDFADNSSAAALGKDTSGNGNNWTTNNLSANTPGYSNTIATAQVWSNYLTPDNQGWDPGREAAKAFDNDAVSFAYINDSATSRTMLFSFPGGISGHAGYVWLRGGNGNGDGLHTMTVLINGTTGALLEQTGTRWESWFKYRVSGPLESFRITGPYPALRAVSFWADRSVLVVNNQAVTSGAPAQTGGDDFVDSPTSYGTDTGVGGEVRGNYCTLNPLDKSPAFAPRNGNLEPYDTSAWGAGRSTLAIPPTGKWYAEATMLTNGTNSLNNWNSYLGFGLPSYNLASAGFGEVGAVIWTDGYMASNWDATDIDNTTTNRLAGDVIGIVVDRDANTFQFRHNNAVIVSGTIGGGLGKDLFFIGGIYSGSTGSYAFNFGQRPFAYTAPSGFKALCDTNLPAPTIVKPSTVMDVKLYTGNGSTQTISGLGFSPDLVWGKVRSTTGDHHLVDSVRGDASGTTNKTLFTTSTEGDYSGLDRLFNFSSTGFTAGGVLNTDTATYVAWCWDAGSSTVTNTAGTIQSSVRANASAGFSIVTYTGTGANATVGHGLGVAPQFYVVKNRSVSGEWYGYHVSSGAGNYLLLNTTAAATASTTVWNNTAPSSTVFSLGASSSNTASSNFVAYCFAPVAGYSAFGSYTGNGSADGPFVYTGFRPRWVMVKAISGAAQWFIYDAARSPSNASDLTLFANSPGGGLAYEGGNNSLPIDILSNGFKLRLADTGGYTNYSTWNYIYAAFAEAPFQYARAR